MTLKQIENQTVEMCMKAVQQNGMELKYVKEQTPEICIAAVQQNGLALEFVKEQTPEICLLAVKEDGAALKFVKEQSDDICLKAVTQDGMALKYVKEQTPEIVSAALNQNKMAQTFIREGLREERSLSKENKDMVDGTAAISEEEFMRAQREVDEQFWSNYQTIDSKNNSQGFGADNIDFAKLEQAERNENEILLRERLLKKQDANLVRDDGVSFKELEAAQRKADELYLQMYLSENSVQLGKEVSQIMDDGALYSADTMERICQKYLEYCKEQGVPDDVLALMANPKFSLTQMMQLKFGYEDGLSVGDISKYADPSLQKNEMVISRYNLLQAKRIGINQGPKGPEPAQKKAGLDEKIASGVQKVRNSNEKENVSPGLNTEKNLNINMDQVEIKISVNLVDQESDYALKTRVPGTSGKDVRYLWISKEQVTEQGKMMLTSIDKNKEYKLYDSENQVVESVKGIELYQKHYNKESRKGSKHDNINNNRNTDKKGSLDEKIAAGAKKVQEDVKGKENIKKENREIDR